MQRRVVDTSKGSVQVTKKAETTYLRWSKIPSSSPECSDYEDDFEPLDAKECSKSEPTTVVSNDGEVPDDEYNCSEESLESLDEDKQTAEISHDGQVPDDDYNFPEESSECLDEEEPTAEISHDGQVPDGDYNYPEESSECLDEEEPTARVINDGQVPDDEYNYLEESSECLDEEEPTAEISHDGQVPDDDYTYPEESSECLDEEEPTAEISHDGQVPDDEYNYPEESSECLDEEEPTAEISHDGQVPDGDYNYPEESSECLDEEEPTAEISNDGQVPDDEYNYHEESSECLDEEEPIAEISNDGQVPDDEYNFPEESSECLDEEESTVDVRNEGQVPGRLPQTEHGQGYDGRKNKLETTYSGPHLYRSLSEPSQSKARMVNFKNYIQGRQIYRFEIREENVVPIDELADKKEIEMYVGSEHRWFRSCVDIKLFADYYVVSVNNTIIKYSLDSDKQLDQLIVPGAGRMCYIRKSSRIAVLQTPRGIICLETKPKLSVVYSIRASSIQYMSICHLDSFHRAVNDRNGLPNPMHTFATTATKRLAGSGQMDESIYIIKPTPNKYQKSNCYDEESSIQNIPGLSGICSVHAFLKEKEFCFIVGCKDRVCCVSLADNSIKWTIHLNYPATDVQFTDPYVLVCVQDGCRLFVCHYKSGRIVIDNLLNRDGIRGCKPHKLSVYKSNVLVKFYNNNYWSCVADMNSNNSGSETRHGFPLGTIRISKAV